MRTCLGTVIFLGWSLVAAQAVPAPTKPAPTTPIDINNPSMEQVSEGKTMPDGYYPLAADIAMMVDDHVAFDGKRSIKTILPGTASYSGLICQVSTNVPAGRTIRVKVKVRMQDLDGKAFLEIYQYPPPMVGEFSQERLSGTRDWTTLEAVFFAKPGLCSLQIRMIASGTQGRIWWDQLEVETEK